MHEGLTAVFGHVGEAHAEPCLKSGEMAVVMTIGKRLASQMQRCWPDAGVRQVLDLTVVLVASRLLAN